MQGIGGECAQAGAERHGRDRVLSAARVLFLERGYTGVSMQEIADAAGMRKASLYYHVRDKEDLFVQIVRREEEQLSAGIAAELAAASTLEDGLGRVARFFARAVGSDMGRLMSDFMHHVGPEQRAELRHKFDGLQDLLRGRFEAAAAAGEIRAINPDLATALFLGMLSGVLRQTKERWLDMPFDAALADTIVDIFMRGISAASPVAR